MTALNKHKYNRYWGFGPITKDEFKMIADLGEIDASLIVD